MVVRYLRNVSFHSRFMMDVNYFGSLNVTKSLLPQMQDAGDGVIVFVASQAALIGIYGLTAYCGSKFAVRGFAEALAMEVKGKWQKESQEFVSGICT